MTKPTKQNEATNPTIHIRRCTRPALAENFSGDEGIVLEEAEVEPGFASTLLGSSCPIADRVSLSLCRLQQLSFLRYSYADYFC